MIVRCDWAGPDQIYLDYHDTEWGVPEYDSRALWEKLILDGFQAGLSWITILKKRDNFRQAFAEFDPDVIAGWGEAEVVSLLGNSGIIRKSICRRPHGRRTRSPTKNKDGSPRHRQRSLPATGMMESNWQIKICNPGWRSKAGSWNRVWPN